MKMLSARILLVLLLGLSSCASPMPERAIFDLKSVPPDRQIIMGKVEFHAPLGENEQILKSPAGEQFKGMILLHAGGSLRDFKQKRLTSFDGTFLVDPEKEFYVKIVKNPVFYLSGVSFYAVYDPPYAIETPAFLAPLKTDLRADDDAIYIGTIQYFRDENNKLKSVAVRDDFKWAEGVFHEKFGPNRTLRKALVLPVGPAK